MPIPAEFRPFLARKDFWDAYWDSCEFRGVAADFPDVWLDLEVAPGYGVMLHLEPDADATWLLMRHPDVAGPIELGLEYEGHASGNCLRWDELDRIGRAAALRDPDWAYPGVATLLLAQFAPIRPGDDAGLAHALLGAAFRVLGLFDDREVGDKIARLDDRGSPIAWRPRPRGGWYVAIPEESRDSIDYEDFSGRDHGSLESEDPPHFPHRRWAELLGAADRSARARVDPAWRADAVLWLLDEAATTGDRSGLPALADALEQAGCVHRTILDACRAPEPAARAWWVVETLAGIAPGDLIRRHLAPEPPPVRVSYAIVAFVPLPEAVSAADPAVGERLRDRIAAAVAAEATSQDVRLLPFGGERIKQLGARGYLSYRVGVWDDPRAIHDAVREILLSVGPFPHTRLELTLTRGDGDVADRVETW